MSKILTLLAFMCVFGTMLVYSKTSLEVKTSSLANSLGTGKLRHSRSSFHKSTSKETSTGHRYKRASAFTPFFTWPHRIPYKFVPNFDNETKPLLRRVFKNLMDQICVEWVEEPDFDPKNNTYDVDAFLLLRTDLDVAFATVGYQNKTHGLNVSLHHDSLTIYHELLHTIGHLHEPMGEASNDHLTLVTKNIKPERIRQFVVEDKYKPDLIATDFDGSSTMMYDKKDISLNGLDTHLYFREEESMLGYKHPVNLQLGLYEMNQIYKCKEKYCSHVHTYCGLGYLTRVKNVCQCVCPDGFDSRKNCAELENEDSGPTDWPDVPFGLLRDKQQAACPSGFKTGQMGWETELAVLLADISRGYYHGTRTKGFNMSFCIRKTTTSTKNDMEELPMGQYAVLKPAGVECNGGFTKRQWLFETSINTIYRKGEPIDWPTQKVVRKGINGTAVMLQTCARADNKWYQPMELPRKTPFGLIRYDGDCATIKGMRHLQGFYQQSMTYNSSEGVVKNLRGIHFCNYYPGKYGCSENITLDSTNRQHKVQTPGFLNGIRENNRRCLFNFNVPKDARVKITMDTYDIDKPDLFLIRRFNKWSLPFRDFSYHFKRQFISEKDFLFLEYWSGPDNSTKKGIQFTADVLLAEDSCYDTKNKGRTYTGTKSVTEDFEECLPWSNAVDCPDFPFKSSDALHLMSSSNYCRNPDGSMLQPWCYVSVVRGMCRRKFCDVCNHLDAKDQLQNCTDASKADPDFCLKSLQRSKCPETCGLQLNRNPPATHTCKLPGETREYQVGDVAPVNCTNSKPANIECTMDGWTTQDSACKAVDDCADKSKKCVFISSKDPDFCSRKNSNYLASTYCQKTCGLCPCDSAAFCSKFQSGQTYHLVISPNDKNQTGSVLTFACNQGLHLVSGDLRRACGPRGKLLGMEPVCKSTPEPVDVGLENVLPRGGTNQRSTSFLLDVDEFRIPYDGNVTHWHYYAHQKGAVAFFVFQPRASYNIVKYNIVVITETNKTWSSYIKKQDQISVKKNDVFGFFTLEEVMAITECDDYDVKPMVVKTAKGSPYNNHTDPRCLIPSVGLRIQP